METNAPQSAGLYDFLAWFEANKKRVAIGAGVVAVVALGAGLFVWQRGERVIKAEEALASVRMPYSPLEIPAAGTAEALAKLAADIHGLSFGHRRRYTLLPLGLRGRHPWHKWDRRQQYLDVERRVRGPLCRQRHEGRRRQ